MILTKDELTFYLKQDAKANKHNGIKCNFFGDEIWKYIKSLRWVDYLSHCDGFFARLCFKYWSIRFHILGVKLGFSISNKATIGPGFAIAHYGTVIINGHAKVGKNCRCQTGVCLGATNGTNDSPILGDNIFLGEGCKLIGGIHIADDVAIGANAVVIKDILEPGTTWGEFRQKNIK